jgi:predicted ATPase
MELMDEFIKSKNENKNQFIMESHSEHMLLRIMKRIKQTQNGTLEDESLILTPEDVCLLYVDNDGEQTYIQELRLSKNGKLLDHWPNGFFEEGYKERFF